MVTHNLVAVLQVKFELIALCQTPSVSDRLLSVAESMFIKQLQIVVEH